MELNKSNIKDFLTGCLDNGIYVERLITNNFSDYLEKSELSDDDFQTLVSFMTTNGVLIKDEKGNYETVISFQPGPGTVKYTITTSAGENGQITPLGEIEVNAGEDFTYDVIADKEWVIEDLFIDGEGIKDASGLATYHGVIYNVQKDHIIDAKFDDIKKYEIQISNYKNGAVTPNPVDGCITVTEGRDQMVTFTADEGYEIVELVIDSEGIDDALGKTSYTYTFENVQEDHRIEVSFKENTNAPEV